MILCVLDELGTGTLGAGTSLIIVEHLVQLKQVIEDQDAEMSRDYDAEMFREFVWIIDPLEWKPTEQLDEVALVDDCKIYAKKIQIGESVELDI